MSPNKLLASILFMLTLLVSAQGCWFAAGAATGAAAVEAAEQGDEEDDE